MGDMMQFPERWEDFLRDYEFEDSKRVYTNGSMLIPSFRVEQMMEHYAPVRHGRWIRYGRNLGECSNCGEIVNIRYNYCPNCGCKMLEDLDGKK